MRSLFIFGQDNLGIHKWHTGEDRAKMTLEPVYKNYKLIRVLNLVGIDTSECDSTLPAQIGNLIHLRYLGIKSTNIGELPELIGNLRNLLTLDYRGIEGYHSHPIVPNVIWKMERLRHLYLPDNMASRRELNLDTVKNLQTLWAAGGGDWLLKEMPNLSQKVQKLHIGGISSNEQLEAVFRCPSIASDHLHKLYADWLGQGIKLENMEQISGCNRLYKLGLRGEFPQLEQLGISDLPNLEEWTVEKGAMPRLRKLSIWQCDKLKDLSQALEFIHTLHELKIDWDAEERAAGQHC
ncbi:hypothetical protein Droror1_Dr00022630 [Drosera rotundifolia]